MTNKTEKPTPKKIRDAKEKGQTFKAKDLIISCLLVCGIVWIISMSSLSEFMTNYRNLIAGNFEQDIQAYSVAIMIVAMKFIIPILIVCILVSALPTLLQTGFVVATKALKINLNALNPTKGIKKIFSMRTIKDFIKTLLYLACFIIGGVIFWHSKKGLLFAQLYGDPAGLAIIWGKLLLALLLTCLACILLILILDALADYFLHLKELKMDKQEVKREYKEQDGNPEIKSKRRQLHMEILSEQTKSDIKNSQFIIANPTHIAIGIYYKPEVILAPLVSVRETNQRALAVRAYAKKVGVPVITNIPLARKIYKTNRLYSFVKMDDIETIIDIMTWLHQVDNAWRPAEAEEQAQPTAAESQYAAQDDPTPDNEPTATDVARDKPVN
ncbi:EscU/YscU/HrcU family type III secretion system export apparatus switch protein [Acerihabitans sp. TG2]|uniref:EscU/YscU/HrcU family type III secretion system export apparatus switch protein n=1 Tax=Acerihabitans sp. TG2 TaxID=3096008 RepID=UPI002B2327E3|nr:EscU/YscU/HrcU family type III secretion system export apparatus switch protein [Acerihabitans sp. TG2]MEA9389632.1 EscU/YscU/HrcU family type III secretion system export apparatus switch protein [Acerihabitans sp. TG2]